MSSESRPQSPWFWLAVFFVPVVLFFAVLGVLSAIEKWHIVVAPPQEHPEIERPGGGPWIADETKADFKRRIERIDKEMPLLIADLKFLESALKKEEARARTDPHAQEYVNFIRRQQKSLEDRLEILRSDRSDYAHELHEK
jgi:hypothetical protein